MIRGIDTVSTFIIFKIYMDFLQNMFSDINHLKNVLLSSICHVWGKNITGLFTTYFICKLGVSKVKICHGINAHHLVTK